MLATRLSTFWFKFSKICSTPQQAIQGIKDGSFLMVGGFGICGIPMNLINTLRENQIKGLTIASNNCGYDDGVRQPWGLAVLLKERQIKRMICSYAGENIQFKRQYFNGEIELEICPQGTLAQKIRSGGAGIPAFFTPTGVETIIQQGGFPIRYGKDVNGQSYAQLMSQPKPTSVFNGKKYLMEKSFFADFSLIKAKRADKMGNLEFADAARNFNADMATAANIVIAQVEQIVENGQILPQHVHVPSAYVNRIYKCDPNSKYSEKYIEKLVASDLPTPHKMTKQSELPSLAKEKGAVSSTQAKGGAISKKERIARRAAKQIKSGMSVNLGIGIPTLLPGVLPKDFIISIQSENGILGVGGPPQLLKALSDLIEAGKTSTTVIKGASFFSASQSFAMIRGGHIDMTMLGALEVSRTCDIANWIIPGKMMNGMGGAMDLVASGSKVIVLMEHSARIKERPGEFEKKLLERCNHPLTAKGAVSMVITQLAVFENRDGRLILTELAQETSIEEVQKQTGFTIETANIITRF